MKKKIFYVCVISIIIIAIGIIGTFTNGYNIKNTNKDMGAGIVNYLYPITHKSMNVAVIKVLDIDNKKIVLFSADNGYVIAQLKKGLNNKYKIISCSSQSSNYLDGEVMEVITSKSKNLILIGVNNYTDLQYVEVIINKKSNKIDVSKEKNFIKQFKFEKDAKYDYQSDLKFYDSQNKDITLKIITR